MRDGEQLAVLAGEWIPRPRRLERDEALGELALRYFRSHGPATAADFTRWASLTAADVRTGLALAQPQLAALSADGTAYLMDPGTPELLSTCRHARDVFLLPGFDELILGYADRSATLPAAFASLIVPGGNGVFRPIVISDGRVIGTWKHTGPRTKRTVTATPFSSFSGHVTEAIARVYTALP
jgi:hypothetical protein